MQIISLQDYNQGWEGRRGPGRDRGIIGTILKERGVLRPNEVGHVKDPSRKKLKSHVKGIDFIQGPDRREFPGGGNLTKIPDVVSSGPIIMKTRSGQRQNALGQLKPKFVRGSQYPG